MRATRQAKGRAMKGRRFFNVFLVFLLFLLAGCSKMEAEKHKLLMKGEILEVRGDLVYLCIGSKEGAEVGDQFAVYKFTRAVNTNTELAERPYYKREMVGRIKIVKIFDEHMAEATILSGEAKPNYQVEIED